MKQQGISKLDLKRQNRMQVLKLLKRQGPTSRIDIAATLELTRAAVTIITNEMIEQGIICEIGEQKNVSERAPRGRKKILIDINHHYKFALGVLIDDTQVSVGLSTLAGEVLDKRNITFDESITYEGLLDFLRTSMHEIMSYNCLDERHILGVGVGVFPGVHERVRATVRGNMVCYPTLEKDLRAFTGLPLVLEDSVRALAMANLDFPRDRNERTQNAAFFQYGEHFGSVLLFDNEPSDRAIGSTSRINALLAAPGKENTLLARTGMQALTARVAEALSPESTPHLYGATVGDPEKITLSLIAAAYAEGDTGVHEAVDDICGCLGVMLNNIACLASPEKIILHGFPQELEFLVVRLLERRGEFLPDGGTEVITSSIGDRVQFLGGCAAAIRKLFFERGGFDREIRGEE